MDPPKGGDGQGPAAPGYKKIMKEENTKLKGERELL